MQPADATLDEYCGFISNPQAEGVWCMRLELSETQANKLTSFLNIQGYGRHQLRGHYYSFPGRAPFYAYEDRPPIILPRLFAYLRAAIPQKERAGLPNLTVGEDILFRIQGDLRGFQGLARRKAEVNPTK